jgi:flagellin-like hook-associated protein FlgL
MSTPSTPANDASAAFEWARLEEEQATGDALTELAYQEYDEDPFTPLSEPSAPPASPGTPAAPEANTGDPAASQTPSGNEPAEGGEGEEEAPIFDGLDTIASAIRGVVQGPLDLADNVGDAINSAVGEPLMRLMTLGASEEIKEAAMASLRKQGPSGREILEERYGAPESLTGMLAQGMTSQLVFIVPGTRALKATGMGTFAANTAASAATAAGTSREGDGNLSTLATTMGQGNVLFDNPLTQALAVDADDATWERLLKTTIEDIGLSYVTDGTIDVAARAFRKFRKTVPEIESVAARDPEIVTDPELGETAMRAANARVKKAVLDETVAQADEAATGAREAGEFRGDDAGAPDPALDEAAAMTQNELTTAREALQQEIDEADAALVEMAKTTEADGRYVEAYRQMMRDILDGNVNQALGDAATRNMPARPPEPQKTKLGNFLEANEGTLDALHYAYETGDIAELERLFGAVYDNTNYNNITAEGGVAQLIEAQGAIFGNSTASPRVQTTWGLVDVGESTVADLEEMVTNAGGSMNALERSLAQLGADVTSSIKDFRVKFNQLRAAEVSVASRLATLLDQWEQAGPGGASDNLRVEILQTHELAAHLTEIRSGGSSEIAGALGDHRLTFEPLDFDALLDVDRAARSEELAAHVAKNGGAGKIDPMIEALLHSRRAGIDALLDTNAGAKHAVTLGDLAYEAFISNILSSPTTQAINISSNAMRSVAWDPTSKFFAASGRALLAQDLTGFKALRGHIEGLIAGTTGAFKYDAALGGSRLATAWRRGERVTGRPGGLFAEATTRPDRSLLNTRGLSRFVRDGASVRLPFTRALGAGKHGDGINLPLMPLPKATRNSMADWIATRTGPVSRAVNYMGSAMGWIGRSLAVGDELFAGMAYRAQLYADAVEVAVGEGLTGAELAKRVDFIRRMTPQIDLLRKRSKMVDPGTRANLNQLAEIHQNASKYAERATYATQNDATRFLEKAKNIVPGFRWFAPFVRTPLNLAEQGVVDFSPLGPAAKAFMAIPEAARGDRKAIGEALGRLGMVGGIYSLVWKMAEDGAFTGGGPHNPAEREVWLLNNRPYSFKLNGEWYSYNRFDPIAMPLGILADMMYLNGRTPDGQVEDKLHEQAIMVLMNAVKSRTFLQGIAEIAHIMQTPQSTWAQSLVVSKLQNTLIPGSRMWATLEKGGLPMPEDLRVAITEGEVEGGLLGDFLNGRPEKQLVDMRNPVVHFGTATARDLPAGIQEGFVQLWNSVFSAKNAISMVPDRDFFGEVRVTPEGMGPDFLSPFQILPDGDDPVADELARLGYGHSNRERFGKLYGLELTPEQRDRFHLYFVKPTKDTKPLREALEDLMLDEDGNLSEAFQSLGDPITLELGEQRGGKLEAIDKVVGRYMKAAKKQMLKNDEEVRKAYTEKRRVGILARGQEGTERLRAEREEAEANDTSSLFRALDGGV